MPNIKRGMMGAAGAGGAVGYQLWAWGEGEEGKGGWGDASAKNSPVQIGSEEYWLGRDPDDANSIKQSIMESHCLTVTNAGALFAWGNDGAGRLGDGSTTNTSSPVQIGSLTNWDNVGASERTSAAVKTDGTLWTWGDGINGLLGTDSATDISSPAQVGSLTDWDIVPAGYHTMYSVKTNGTLWAWGKNTYGQIGDGSTTTRSSPVQIGSLTTWKNVAAGVGSCAAIKTDGTLWVWGRNGVGQLGTSNTTNYSSPVQVGSATNWAQVSYHLGRASPEFGGWMAVTTDGTLFGTGTQTYAYGPATGEIGVGDTTTYSVPQQVGSLTDWKNVSCGNASTLAIKTDGTLWTWGRGYYGLNAQGNNNYYSSPVQIGSDTAWVQIGQSGKNTKFAMRT